MAPWFETVQRTVVGAPDPTEIARAQNGNGPLILTGASPTVARLLAITELARHPGLDIRGGARG